MQRADFASITPSARTLRLTQLQHRVAASEQSLRVLVRTTAVRTGLAILGTRTGYRRRGQRLRQLDAVSRQERRVVARLVRRGVSRVATARARHALVTGEVPAELRTAPNGEPAEGPPST